MWLSAGRDSGLVPPWVLGRLHSVLLERFMEKTAGEGLAFSHSCEEDIQGEEVLLRPWLKENLTSLMKTLLELQKGDIITCLLRHPPEPQSDHKCPEREVP